MNRRNQPNSPPRVALYARVSPGPTQAEGFSIEAQLAEMREFAAARGWKVVAEFVDVSVSGRTMERPELEAAKAAAAEGSFDILLVHELSRLSRASVYETFEIFEFLGSHNVGFASAREPQFDLSSPNGRFVLTIISAVNQYYIDILRMHTQKSKRQRVREGLYNASILPYGYRHAGDAKTPPEIDPEEAKVPRLAFERYATGRYSYQDIADILNDRGYRTRRGKRFSKDTIADMIRNPFYMGKVVYKGGSRRQEAAIIEPGLHEPIISEQLWEVCRQVRERHQSASRPFQPQVRTYLLGQLAYCHVCHRKLRAQSTKTAIYYREMSYARGYEDCPNANKGTRGEGLHAQMSAIVRQLVLPPNWQQELADLVGEDEGVATLENRRARLIAERRRLKQAYIQGDFEDDLDLYRQNLARIRRELAQIPTQDELYRIQEASQYIESLAEVWDEADIDDQKDLMRLMLREVQVDVGQGRLVWLQPTAPFIPLFRAVPTLAEREPGLFVPHWPPEMAVGLSIASLPSLTVLPEEPVALPWLAEWPWEPDPKARITPALGAALKERRKVHVTGGRVVAVPCQGVPELLLDGRKWAGVTLEERTLPQALALPKESVAFLSSPLGLQAQADWEALARRVYEVLETQGYWHILDVLPASMPAHWVYTFFPETWVLAQHVHWSGYQLYNTLRQIGFHIRQQEVTFYQPVSLGAALRIARQKPGLLKRLDERSYRAGMERLNEAVEEKGPDALMGSEITLVEVTALKGEPPKRRRRKAAVRAGGARKEKVEKGGKDRSKGA